MGMCLGMCLGISIGTSLGNVFGNTSIGILLGLAIGLVIGFILGSQKDNVVNNQIEEKGYRIKKIEKDEKSEEYILTIIDNISEETVVIVSEGEMETELFKIGDVVFFDKDGNIEQAFDKEDE